MRSERLNLIAALIAAFVGCLALAVSTYGVLVQHQQVRAQVWPRLEWNTSNLAGFKVHIINVGVGPAEIRTVAVRVDGTPARNWREALSLLGIQSGSWETSYLKAGRVIPAGSDIAVLSMPVVPARYSAITDRLSVDLCYCSVLGECWTLVDAPMSVRRGCPAPAVAFENN